MALNHPVMTNRGDRMKYWEIIANNLKKAGWSYGYVSAIDSEGRTIWIADTHRDDGKRFVVRADDKLTAFLELESAIRGCGRFDLLELHPSLKSAAWSCVSCNLGSRVNTAARILWRCSRRRENQHG